MNNPNTMPGICPSCKVNLLYRIQVTKADGTLALETFSRVIGLYDLKHDRTTEYQCPDCSAIWPREGAFGHA